MFMVPALRPGELLALHRDDVKGQFVRIDQSASWKKELASPKNNASNGFVWVPVKLAAELKEWMDSMNDRSPEALLFASRRGTPFDRHNFLGRNLKRIVAAALEARSKARVKTPPGYLTGVNPQAFRRTCATWAKRGGDLKDVQAMLRHASPVMTAGVHMQSIPESVQRTVEALDEQLRGTVHKCLNR